MTLNDVQRAALAMFAARAAGQGGSLEQMKAIAYCVRNQVKAGWWDGKWLVVMEHAYEAAGNHPEPGFPLDPDNRALQRLVADIDDIYYGGRTEEGSTSIYSVARAKPPVGPAPAQRFAPDGGDLEQAIGKCCYWAWINRPFTPWFQKNILDRPEKHFNRTNMGLMAFFE